MLRQMFTGLDRLFEGLVEEPSPRSVRRAQRVGVVRLAIIAGAMAVGVVAVATSAALAVDALLHLSLAVAIGL